jgi:hypothetical protein
MIISLFAKLRLTQRPLIINAFLPQLFFMLTLKSLNSLIFLKSKKRLLSISGNSRTPCKNRGPQGTVGNIKNPAYFLFILLVMRLLFYQEFRKKGHISRM